MASSTLNASVEIINETGKTMHQWFSELERREFQCIHWRRQVTTLAEDYQLDEVWAEKIAAAYCSECGLPWKDQVGQGHRVSVTKTFHQPLAHAQMLVTAWFDGERRAVPLPALSSIDCSLYEWVTDNSIVTVKLESKSEHKTRLVIQHDEIEGSADAEIMRIFWKSHLRSMIETF